MSDFEYEMQNFEGKIRNFFGNIRQNMRTEINEPVSKYVDPRYSAYVQLQDHHDNEIDWDNDIGHRSNDSYNTTHDDALPQGLAEALHNDRWCGSEYDLRRGGSVTTDREKKNYKSNISNNAMYQYHYNGNNQRSHDTAKTSDTHPQSTLRRRINAKKQNLEQDPVPVSVYKHDDIFHATSFPPIDFRLERSYVEETPYRHNYPRSKTEARDVVIQICDDEPSDHHKHEGFNDVKKPKHAKSRKNQNSKHSNLPDHMDVDLEMGYGPTYKKEIKNNIQDLVQDAYTDSTPYCFVEPVKQEYVRSYTSSVPYVESSSVGLDKKNNNVYCYTTSESDFKEVPKSQTIVTAPQEPKVVESSVKLIDQVVTETESITDTVDESVIDVATETLTNSSVYSIHIDDVLEQTKLPVQGQESELAQIAEIESVEQTEFCDKVEKNAESDTPDTSEHVLATDFSIVVSDTMKENVIEDYVESAQDVPRDVDQPVADQPVVDQLVEDQSVEDQSVDEHPTEEVSGSVATESINESHDHVVSEQPQQQETDLLITEDDLNLHDDAPVSVQLINRVSNKKKTDDEAKKVVQTNPVTMSNQNQEIESSVEHQIIAPDALLSERTVEEVITEDDIVCPEVDILEDSSIGFSDSEQLIPNLITNKRPPKN